MSDANYELVQSNLDEMTLEEAIACDDLIKWSPYKLLEKYA